MAVEKNLIPGFSFRGSRRSPTGPPEKSSAKQNKSGAGLYLLHTDVCSLPAEGNIITFWFFWGRGHGLDVVTLLRYAKKERLRCKKKKGRGWVGVALPNIKRSQINMPHMSGISIHQIKRPRTPEPLCIQADVQFQTRFLFPIIISLS